MSLKIGIISFAHMHAHSYASALTHSDRAHLVGITDDDPDRGRSMSEQYQTRFFDSPDSLIPECDALIITSENKKHAPLTLQVAAAGKPILCEKPLMTTLEEGQQMLQAAKEAGVELYTAFPCRFSPAMLRLKAIVNSEELGEIYAMRGTNRGQNPGGWFNQVDLAGGGAMIDHTVHVTDLMRWMLGANVKNVYAETNNFIYGGDFDDTAMLTMEFENGIFATLDSSWSRPKKSFPTWGDVTLGVTGSNGVAEMDMFAQNLTHYSEERGKGVYVHYGANIDAQMVKGFLDKLEGKDTDEARILATGEDGYQAAAVAIAAYQSLNQGPVAVG